MSSLLLTSSFVYACNPYQIAHGTELKCINYNAAHIYLS